jgi:hypothetical protein
MQSSLVTALRALIMLSVLVALPLAALRGARLPERAWKVVEAVQERVGELIGRPAAASETADLPPLDLSLPLRHPAQEVAPSAMPEPIVAPLEPPRDVSPTHLTAARVEPTTRPTSSAGDGAPLRTIQRELRALGATDCVLETWGERGELYRFQADVAVRHDPNFHRNFQALHGDPLAAMREVLAQVRDWRAREPRRTSSSAQSEAFSFNMSMQR